MENVVIESVDLCQNAYYYPWYEDNLGYIMFLVQSDEIRHSVHEDDYLIAVL